MDALGHIQYNRPVHRQTWTHQGEVQEHVVTEITGTGVSVAPQLRVLNTSAQLSIDLSSIIA